MKKRNQDEVESLLQKLARKHVPKDLREAALDSLARGIRKRRGRKLLKILIEMWFEQWGRRRFR
jgi:hypothetical protein